MEDCVFACTYYYCMSVMQKHKSLTSLSSNTKLPFGMQATYFVTLRHYQPQEHPIFQPFCQRGLLIWGVLVPSTQYKLSYALHTNDTSNQSKTLQEHKYRNNHTNLSKSKAKPLP